MHDLRLILVVVGIMAIIALLLHGLWTSYKENWIFFYNYLVKRFKQKNHNQNELSLFGSNQDKTSNMTSSDFFCKKDSNIDIKCIDDYKSLSTIVHSTTKKQKNRISDSNLENDYHSFINKDSTEYYKSSKFCTIESNLPVNNRYVSYNKDCMMNIHVKDNHMLNMYNNSIMPQLDDNQSSIVSAINTNAKKTGVVEDDILKKIRLSEKEIILVLHVISHNRIVLGGKKLIQSILQSGFQFGNMNIFHRHLNPIGSGPILFSLANMVKPGSFDVDNMTDFITPGISTFMTVPSYGNAYQNFKLMLQSAQNIADDCGGIVLDDDHKVINSQTLEAYKARIHQILKTNISI